MCVECIEFAIMHTVCTCLVCCRHAAPQTVDSSQGMATQCMHRASCLSYGQCRCQCQIIAMHYTMHVTTIMTNCMHCHPPVQDLELEEFKALEQQIKRDVGSTGTGLTAGTRSRQASSPTTSSLGTGSGPQLYQRPASRGTAAAASLVRAKMNALGTQIQVVIMSVCMHRQNVCMAWSVELIAFGSSPSCMQHQRIYRRLAYCKMTCSMHYNIYCRSGPFCITLCLLTAHTALGSCRPSLKGPSPAVGPRQQV